MLWWLVALLSATLILTGMTVIWRDTRRSRPARHAASRSATESVPPPLPDIAAGAGAGGTAVSARDVPVEDDDAGLAGLGLPRLPAVEAAWHRMAPEVAAAAAAVSHQIAPLGLAFGAPGTPNWSLHNRGFGDYRRVLIDGDSLAWLRIETSADGKVAVKLRAHDPEIAMINGNAIAPPARPAGELGRAMLESLATTVQYANWRLANVPRTAPPSSRPATVAVAAPLPTTGRVRDQVALTDAAIALVNEAFRESGARLLPLAASQWPATAGRDARVLAIDARGALAGTMLVDPQPERIDIAATSGRSATVSAARRQSLAVTGLSVHALAEAIATLAWPAVAAMLPQG